MEKITLVNCKKYIENPYVCDDFGAPKGQCVNCGAKWFEHKLNVLSNWRDFMSAKFLQTARGISIENNS